MAKETDRKMLIVVLLLAFILAMIIVKNNKPGLESYVAIPRATAARVDANTYTGPGDALRGPVRPATKPRRRARARVNWYQPWTWGNYFVIY